MRLRVRRRRRGPRTGELIGRLRELAEAGIDTVVGRVDGLEKRTPIEHLIRHVVPVAGELESRRS